MALVLVAPCSTVALAQDAADEGEDESGLNTIVVTASGGDQRQIESSISVTSVDDDLIANFQPASEAEIFRLLPGIQTPGTSGPGGNANIAVRGLPVATGGAPFVQLQEDGLPLVLFGDIQFGNNDYWTRFDASVASIEAVRGGSATTFASQAPGAVINYISHTGEREGGFVQLNRGLGYNDTRLDFRYGGSLADDLYFHVGGYFQRGDDALDVGYTINDSLQIRGNLTKEFGDGGSFLRLFFKVADTQGINYTGAPALADFDGARISNIRAFPGFDGRRQTNYSIYNQEQLIYNRDGDLERVGINGISTSQQYVGAQLHYELGDSITIDNRARYSDMSGSFSSPFMNVATRGSVIGSSVNGATVAAIRFADGPNAGQLFTGEYLDNNVNVTTNMRDLGAFVNDLVLAGEFDVGGSAQLTARGGFFYMDQTIAMDWHVNRSTRELSGDNPSQLDLFDAAGNQLTYQGVSGYNNNWGSCCARDYDLGYTNTAPYAQLVLDHDRFNIDASVRFERLSASGYAIAGGNSFLVAPDPSNPGLQIEAITANGTRERLDYSRSYTSWSVGALFKASDDLSLFGRVSRGGRFNADRQTLGGKIGADGSLCSGADALAGSNGCAADGFTPSVDFVNQYELGVKARGELGGGDWTAEFTLLQGDFSQSTFELSATRCGGAGGCIIDSEFESSGFEFFGTYRNGGLMLVANATYSDAQRKLSGATDFTRAPFIPDLSYSVSATYDIGDMVTLGLAATGQTAVVDDALRSYEGATTFNGSLRIRPIEDLEFGLNIYNIFNTYDLRGNGANLVNGGVTPAIVSGTPVPGRYVNATVRLAF